MYLHCEEFKDGFQTPRMENVGTRISLFQTEKKGNKYPTAIQPSINSSDDCENDPDADDWFRLKWKNRATHFVIVRGRISWN